MRRAFVVLVAGLVAAGAARGVPVEKWVQATQADFSDAEADGTAVLPLGQVVLAPEVTLAAEESVTHVWALAADAQGAVYAATGIEAKLLRLRGDKLDTAFTSPDKGDIELYSVAIGPDGTVYAGAAPSGTLYRIAPDGKAEPLYKGSDPYIWSLAVAPDGTLYAGTGPNGKLLKIDRKGKATTVLEANANHILCVVLAPDGSAFAGTDKEGLLYHVTPKGEARVAYDAAESDIRALALDPEGQLYFATAATAGQPQPSPKPATPTPTPPSGRTTIVIRRPGANPSREARMPTPPRGATRPSSAKRPSAPGASLSATNAIYRLSPDGAVTKVASVQGVAFHALAWHNGRLYAGTGNDGKLYTLEDDKPVQLAHLDESQITAFAVAGGQLVLGTANPGQLYRVAAAHAREGTLVSDVYDTGSQSRFGQIAWEARTPAGTSLTLSTRTGNTARPDDTWSPWAAESTQGSGQAIQSPPARFIQYRATLKTSKPEATPVLDEVIIAYVQTNQPPEVTSVQLSETPKPQPPQPRPQPGQPVPPRPTPKSRPMNTKKQPVTPQRGPFGESIRITWQAADPNKDDLLCAVYFRGEDETTWKKLEERLAINFLDWDTTNVPDGPYRIRVVASDEGSNPPDQALQGDFVTDTVTIDNTPPAVPEVKARVGDDGRVTVTARCTDAGSGIGGAEYSVDAGPWISAAAADGIFDSAAETVELKTEPLGEGEHTLVVRARDDAGNTGAGKSVFVVK